MNAIQHRSALVPTPEGLLKIAPAKAYIEIRDDLRRAIEADGQSGSDRPSEIRVAMLELANRICFILIKAKFESTQRTLELLHCEACELLIMRIRREQHPLPPSGSRRANLAFALTDGFHDHA